MLTIEHRVIGQCHPVFVFGLMDHTGHAAKYAIGDLPPNYPVPCTMGNAWVAKYAFKHLLAKGAKLGGLRTYREII